MKRLMTTLLILSASSSVPLAQYGPTIGIYNSPSYYLCFGDLEVYVPKTVYMAAWLPTQIPAMTACEFSIDHLPDPADVIVTEDWTADLVIGDLGWDIALAWTTPQPGPWVAMGEITFLALVDLGAYYQIFVDEGRTCGCLEIVDDDFNEHDLDFCDRGMFTFNCGNPNSCSCMAYITTTEGMSWGSLKSLY